VPEDRPPTVDIDVPSDLCLGNETWRLHWYGKILEPSGQRVLTAICVPVIGGVVTASARTFDHDAFALASAIAGTISQHACCDRHAQELAQHIGEEIVKHTAFGRQWHRQRAGKPN